MGDYGDNDDGGAHWAEYGEHPRSSRGGGGGVNKALQSKFKRLEWRCKNYDADAVSEVEKIVEEKKPGRVVHYKVRYRAFPNPKYDTWVPETCENITARVIAAWKEEKKRADKNTSADAPTTTTRKKEKSKT
jgi:hypothetical protein